MFKLFLGKIYTSFKPLRSVEAMLVGFGRVLWIGDAKRGEALCRELVCEAIDLGNSIALPGFVDAHAHLEGVGRNIRIVDLRNVESIEELKEKLRSYASRTTSDWIVGRGWDQEKFREKRWPTKLDLDEVSRDRKVLIVRVCGHAGVVNSRVIEELKLVEIFGSNPNLVRDERGEPTGIVLEEVLSYVYGKYRESEEIEELIDEGQREFLRYGVTGIGYVSVDLRALVGVLSLASMKKLKLRASLYLDLETVEKLKDLGIPLRSLGIDRAKIVGIKIFADGSLGARTAWLSKPYSDDPTNSGTPLIDAKKLRYVIEMARDLDLSVAIHAIGDRALDLVLKVVEETSAAEMVRIEHASIVRDDQLDALAKLRIPLVVQPHFVITDWWVVKRVGTERARYVYRFRDFVEKNIPTAFSTDAPVEPVNPWETIYAAITRGKDDGIELYEHTRDQVLDLATALYLYTEASARIAGIENVGKLEPGYLADIAVIDRDPFELEPREIRRISNAATYIEGERVYP